jgi:hypothetical protein
MGTTRDKHMGNLELHASIALSSPEIRKVTTAYETPVLGLIRPRHSLRTRCLFNALSGRALCRVPKVSRFTHEWAGHKSAQAMQAPHPRNRHGRKRR